jgi:hypothetical protein
VVLEERIFGMPSSFWDYKPRQERRDWSLAMARDTRDHVSIWRGLAQDWYVWDFIRHDQWKPIFKRARPAWTLDVFSDAQREMYQSIPDQVTIYRGCNTDIRHGHRRLSWTLDKDVAHWFARRGALFLEGGEPVVYKGVLDKKDVALVFDGREYEIVPFDAKAIRDIESFALDEVAAKRHTRRKESCNWMDGGDEQAKRRRKKILRESLKRAA